MRGAHRAVCAEHTGVYARSVHNQGIVLEKIKENHRVEFVVKGRGPQMKT
jgi:hypothetical protein